MQSKLELLNMGMASKNKLIQPQKFAKIPEASEQEERRKSHLTTALDMIDDETPKRQDLEDSNLFG